MKKLTALLLAGALCMGLAACGTPQNAAAPANGGTAKTEGASNGGTVKAEAAVGNSPAVVQIGWAFPDYLSNNFIEEDVRFLLENPAIS